MIFGIFNAIIGSIATILYKKALEGTKGIISSKLYQLIGSIIVISLGLIGYIFLDFQTVTISVFGLLFLSAIVGILGEVFEQFAYKNEKLTTLLPYGEFETVFAVVLGFIFFDDNNIYSFVFALLAGVTLVLGSINLKNISFNKYCGALIFSALLGSIRLIILGYILLSLTAFNAFLYKNFAIFLILITATLITKDLFKIKNIPKKIGKYIFAENVLWFIYGIIMLFLISELGIVQAVLIGMLYMVFSMIAAYVFLKEIPTKKEIIIVTLVVACISGGMYF